MIVIDRQTGAASVRLELDEETRKAGAAAIFAAYLDAHPEAVERAIKEVTGCASSSSAPSARGGSAKHTASPA